MNRPEQILQRQVVDALDYILAPDVVFAAHLPAPVNSPKMGAINKALGMKAGLPDLWFYWPQKQCGAIELKATKGRLSDTQEIMHARLRKAGVMVDIARSLDGVIDTLKTWGCPVRVR